MIWFYVKLYKVNLIISYQKYQQPVYTGENQFLVPQAGGPPLIMQPQMAPAPRQPMFTEEVRLTRWTIKATVLSTFFKTIYGPGTRFESSKSAF